MAYSSFTVAAMCPAVRLGFLHTCACGTCTAVVLHVETHWWTPDAVEAVA